MGNRLILNETSFLVAEREKNSPTKSLGGVLKKPLSSAIRTY